jgi:hypothetical protein
MEMKELVKLSEKGKCYLTVSTLGNVMLMKWEGLTPEEIFKKGIDKIEELLFAHKPACCLYDLTTHAGISPGSQKYAADAVSNYVKKEFTVAHSDKKFRQVFIVPNDIFVSVSAKGYKNKLDGDMETIFTNSITEAHQLVELK